MRPNLESGSCIWMKKLASRISNSRFVFFVCAAAMISLGGCGPGIVPDDGNEEREPSWECEQPLNGNEEDGCGNRRPNPSCDAPLLCGNGVTDPGEACDAKGNTGCSGSTPVCKPDCSGCTADEEECTPSWQCEIPLNGYESDGCDNRRANAACASAGKVLFDGTIQPSWTDTKMGTGTGYNSVWKGWYCIPKDDSLTFMPASALPGGRDGYAAKFINRPTPEYDCGGNAHNQLAHPATDIPNPNREVWYGWSQMLDSSWLPNNPGTWNNIGFSGGSSKFKGGGLGNTGLKQLIENGASDRHIVVSINLQFFRVLDNHEVGVWYDWMYHVRYATDKTGFLEVYLRKPGQADYEKIWSKSDFATWYIGFPGQTEENDAFWPRIGMYRSSASSSTQIMYIMDPKIGITRTDVEYAPK